MIKTLLRHKTDNTFIQMFRSVIVGIMAFISDFYALFIITEFLHIHYLISAIFAFILGITVNYILSIMWVFNKRTFSKRRHEVVIFTLIGVIGLGLTELFMWFFTEHVHFHYLISKIVSSMIVYFWNFLNRKFILFR